MDWLQSDLRSQLARAMPTSSFYFKILFQSCKRGVDLLSKISSVNMTGWWWMHWIWNISMNNVTEYALCCSGGVVGVCVVLSDALLWRMIRGNQANWSFENEYGKGTWLFPRGKCSPYHLVLCAHNLCQYHFGGHKYGCMYVQICIYIFGGFHKSTLWPCGPEHPNSGMKNLTHKLWRLINHSHSPGGLCALR